MLGDRACACEDEDCTSRVFVEGGSVFLRRKRGKLLEIGAGAFGYAAKFDIIVYNLSVFLNALLCMSNRNSGFRKGLCLAQTKVVAGNWCWSFRVGSEIDILVHNLYAWLYPSCHPTNPKHAFAYHNDTHSRFCLHRRIVLAAQMKEAAGNWRRSSRVRLEIDLLVDTLFAPSISLCITIIHRRLIYEGDTKTPA